MRRPLHNPLWQRQRNHCLGFCPSVRHGNRNSTLNPLQATSLIGGTLVRNPNTTCGTHARADKMTGRSTTMILRDQDLRHLSVAHETRNSHRLSENQMTFLGTPQRNCSAPLLSTPLARKQSDLTPSKAVGRRSLVVARRCHPALPSGVPRTMPRTARSGAPSGPQPQSAMTEPP
jgi:hypothetical protein